MQVRHIDVAQLDLAKVEKDRLEPPPALISAEGKPWEEVLECLALLAAVHAQPCGAAKHRSQDDDAEESSDDNRDDPPAP